MVKASRGDNLDSLLVAVEPSLCGAIVPGSEVATKAVMLANCRTVLLFALYLGVALSPEFCAAKPGHPRAHPHVSQPSLTAETVNRAEYSPSITLNQVNPLMLRTHATINATILGFGG